MTENQVLHSAFVAAKSFLHIERPFICVALQRAEKVGWISHAAVRAAHTLILTRLNPGYRPGDFVGDLHTAGSWLRERVDCSEIEAAGGAGGGTAELLEYRHRWLDSLIEEFSEKT
mgnify:CR=1 FL=1